MTEHATEYAPPAPGCAPPRFTDPASAAAWALRAIGVEGEPTREDVWRLAALLAPRVTVLNGALTGGLVLYWPNGDADIFLPAVEYGECRRNPDDPRRAAAWAAWRADEDAASGFAAAFQAGVPEAQEVSRG